MWIPLKLSSRKNPPASLLQGSSDCWSCSDPRYISLNHLLLMQGDYSEEKFTKINKKYLGWTFCKDTVDLNSDIYLKRVEIECSNRSSVFVRLSHYSISISSGAHYDLWVIYSQCAIFTATNQSPSSTICSHSKIHPYDTVQPTEEEKYRELLNVWSVRVTPNRNMCIGMRN